MEYLSPDQQIIFRLAVALAIGLLIGLERGWKEKDTEEGARIAGLRTYALLGLLGGSTALIAVHLDTLVLLGLAFLAVAGVLTAAYLADFRCNEDVGITSLVASLLTFTLGALAGAGQVTGAGAAAVVAALLLGFKPLLHGWVEAVRRRELYAGLKLLVISVVLLPILPDRGYGPWQALNPFEIWWLVVLIAAISFAGYFAVKLVGAGRGALYTGLFAGLASSTAVTLHFARLARDQSGAAPLLATGALLASGVMLPRLLLVVAIIHVDLVRPLLVPAAVMAAVTFGGALLVCRRAADGEEVAPPMENPLELKTALTFGLLLATVMLAAEAARAWLGDPGILALALVSGGANMDAATLYLTRMSQGEVTLAVAATGIIIAAAANNVVKAVMAAVVGGAALGLRVVLPLVLAALAGVAIAWLGLW